MCITGKVKHSTRKVAKKAARMRPGAGLHVFKCPSCGKFHTGRSVPGETRELHRHIHSTKYRH